MFWRRKKSDGASAARGAGKAGSNDDEDDIAKLQRQFGIKPVSDADVQMEFQTLFGGHGAVGSSGLSPRTEMALFGGHGADEDDEEAKILRALKIDGGSIDKLGFDDMDDDDDIGQSSAKHELKGVLHEVHATAAHHHSQNDPLSLYAGETPRSQQPGGGHQDSAARVHALKVEALALKREGKIKEALALFRQAKELDAQTQTGAPTEVAHRVGQTSPVPSPCLPPTQTRTAPVAAASVVGYGEDDDDVEVTEEDMQDPEFLAQLTKMGLSHADVVQPVGDSVASLEAEIQDTKLQALEFKRNNHIQEALQCMRKIKELEGKLAQLASAPSSLSVSYSNSTTVTSSGATHSVLATNTTRTAINLSHEVAVTHAYTAAMSTDDPMGEEEHSDIEVTDNDMEDPAFAEELRRMGFDPSAGGDDDSHDERRSTAPNVDGTTHDQAALAPPSTSTAFERTPLLRATSTMDDEDLIDAFDEEDDERVYTPSSAMQVNYGTLAPEMPSIPAPPQQQQEHLEVTDLQTQLQHTKETALRLKREGDVKEALDMMRRIKQIEALIEHKQKMRNAQMATVPVQDPVVAAKFQQLEQVLVDFGNRALAMAKENLSVNRGKSTEWLNKRKEYAAELDKLRAKRQNPLQAPPQYRIETFTREVEFQLAEIPADQVFVSIHSVNGLQSMAGRDIFVKFCLNFPSATPHEGKTGIVRVSSNSPYSTGKLTQQNQFRFPVQRSRGTQRLFEIKKAHFEVWTSGTFLRNPELVARGYQALISIRFRAPLRDKEMRVETVEELHVGEYPEPAVPNTIATPHIPIVPNSNGVPAQSVVAANMPQMQQDKQEMVASDPLDDDDPHRPDLIVSYDVINEELEKIEARLPSLHGQVALELRDRYDSLALKKQLLEIEMETGKLTLDMYVEKLHSRIKDDRKLIAKLMKRNRRTDAARVLHRVKVMEKELVGADGDGSEVAAAT